jgi:HSP20 family molecular chaperone IbpA
MNMLSKINPFTKTEQFDLLRPLPRFDMLRDMDDMIRNMQRAFTTWPARGEESLTLTDWTPSVDIGENDKEYLVKAELPEVNKEDIKVTVDDGTLSICGERKAEKEEKGTKFHGPTAALNAASRCRMKPIPIISPPNTRMVC